MTQPVEYEQLAYNATTGAQFGNSTNVKIGFYGTTPIAKPTTVGTPVQYVASSGGFGFTSASNFSTFVQQHSTLVGVLGNLGLIV